MFSAYCELHPSVLPTCFIFCPVGSAGESENFLFTMRRECWIRDRRNKLSFDGAADTYSLTIRYAILIENDGLIYYYHDFES